VPTGVLAGALAEAGGEVVAAPLVPAGRLAPGDVARRTGAGVEVTAGAGADVVTCTPATPLLPVGAALVAAELCECAVLIVDSGEVLVVGGGVAWVETGQPTARPDPPVREVVCVPSSQDRPGGYGAAPPDVDGNKITQHATHTATMAPQR
jgi:hypothetical protein